MFRGCIISKDPLVVVSSMNQLTPAGIISQIPECFSGKKSLHFLSPAWSLLTAEGELEGFVKDAGARFPDAIFIVLANEEIEQVQLQAHGITSVMGNASIFIEEQIFSPKLNQAKHFDAIYNAALRHFKNHDLCSEIKSLALIYYRQGNENAADLAYEAHVRNTLHQAKFLNDDSSGAFNYLNLSEVAAQLNKAHVGLCLSAKEGTMRACVEYLLCGIPVVSIPAVGGRMRYLNDANSRIVPAHPTSVARAVQDLKQLAISPDVIRNNILSILQFERQCFVDSVNILAARYLGVNDLVLDFSVFKDSINYQTVEQWRMALKG